MPKLSVVVSAYNEEKKIQQCLGSVTWADDIVVVDNSSTDKTTEFAKKYTKRIYRRPNSPMLNSNKNFGFEKATGDWILSLDADEVIPPELAEEIRQKIRNQDVVGYWIPRKNIIFGKWIQHGLWWPDKQLRLFRKGIGKFPCVHVHEYIGIEGKTDTLMHPYMHYNYETISQYLYKLDAIYTESEVNKLTTSQYTLAWYDAIRFPMSDFIKIYFAQRSYLDGLHGLVLSLLQAFYSFIVFAKFWERQKFRDIDISVPQISTELSRTNKEVMYWDITTHLNESKNMFERMILKMKRFFISHE